MDQDALNLDCDSQEAVKLKANGRHAVSRGGRTFTRNVVG
jgi:hypothetical protein